MEDTVSRNVEYLREFCWYAREAISSLNQRVSLLEATVRDHGIFSLASEGLAIPMYHLPDWEEWLKTKMTETSTQPRPTPPCLPCVSRVG